MISNTKALAGGFGVLVGSMIFLLAFNFSSVLLKGLVLFLMNKWFLDTTFTVLECFGIALIVEMFVAEPVARITKAAQTGCAVDPSTSGDSLLEVVIPSFVTPVVWAIVGFVGLIIL